MSARQSVPQFLPQIWLMTDERNDAVLEAAIRALAPRSGIVFRHYHLEPKSREERFAAIRKLASEYGHLLLLSDSPETASKWRADGVHGRCWSRNKTDGLLHSAPVHDEKEIAAAKNADLLFLSPAFATRSHPGKQPLSLSQMKKLIALCKCPVILLGGMDARRFQDLKPLGAHGWAAIDALSG